MRIQVVGGNNNLLHLHNDPLGSNSVMSYNSNDNQVPGSRARYHPYGGWRTAPAQTFTERGYTGHLHNDDLGLIYMNARYYVPYINRFLSADTIVPDREDPQSFNRYSYARNNPINLVDPDGHCWGAASFIRGLNVDTAWGTFGGGTNCNNIDMALAIVQHPDATPEQKAQAGVYLGGWGLAAVSGTAGTGLLACSTVTACAVAAEAVLGIGTTACRDGDCGNEAALLGRAIQNGFNAIQNGVGQGYRSFRAFKNALGSAGEGQAWHHIVNKNTSNVARFGAERIHNTSNFIRLPDGAGEIHRQITGTITR